MGMSTRQIQSRVDAGLLVPLHQGVNRVTGAPRSPEQALLAAALAAGRAAAASHWGAAWLWQLRGFDDPFVEITVPEPVRQYEVAGVRLDAAYPHVKLGMEADSRIWHGGRSDVQRNSDKANVLVAHGWRVLHFTAGHIRRRSSYVVDCVARQLVLACPA